MIPYNKPHLTGTEILNIEEAHRLGQLAGDGKFTKLCELWLEENLNCKKVLLTHSCTAALEMCALLAGIKPGDEIIMPSFTFVSTANAFCLRGGTPIFVDIRPDTMNLNERLVESAITQKTKAIVAVHYAGVACDMIFLQDLCKKRKILLIEDAAQALGTEYAGKKIGTFGDLATLSFHETKNVISGEGGALLINNETFIKQAEIIREKGTDRTSFQRREKEKYTWQQLGSSYLPGELIAAFLYAQLNSVEKINRSKLEIWQNYYDGLKSLEKNGKIRLPIIPSLCSHNGHIFYILLKNENIRTSLIKYLDKKGIHSVFHYIPLHSSPAGVRYCRKIGTLSVTEDMSSRLLRLPSWIGLSNKKVIASIHEFFSR